MMRHLMMGPLVVAGIALATSSCDGILEPRDHTYDGPPVVEFAAVMPAGNYALTVAFPAGSDEDRLVNVGVNYIGEAPAQDVTGGFSVAPASTAVEGTHFSIGDEKRFTIPAGTNVGEITMTIHGGALQDGQEVTLVLELVGGPDVGVSENYKRFTISISKAEG